MNWGFVITNGKLVLWNGRMCNSTVGEIFSAHCKAYILYSVMLDNREPEAAPTAKPGNKCVYISLPLHKYVFNQASTCLLSSLGCTHSYALANYRFPTFFFFFAFALVIPRLSAFNLLSTSVVCTPLIAFRPCTLFFPTFILPFGRTT